MSCAAGAGRYGVELQRRINDVLMHYVEHGGGVPLVALHRAGVDHREIEAAIEAVFASRGVKDPVSRRVHSVDR